MPEIFSFNQTLLSRITRPLEQPLNQETANVVADLLRHASNQSGSNVVDLNEITRPLEQSLDSKTANVVADLLHYASNPRDLSTVEQNSILWPRSAQLSNSASGDSLQILTGVPIQSSTQISNFPPDPDQAEPGLADLKKCLRGEKVTSKSVVTDNTFFDRSQLPRHSDINACGMIERSRQPGRVYLALPGHQLKDITVVNQKIERPTGLNLLMSDLTLVASATREGAVARLNDDDKKNGYTVYEVFFQRRNIVSLDANIMFNSEFLERRAGVTVGTLDALIQDGEDPDPYNLMYVSVQKGAFTRCNAEHV